MSRFCDQPSRNFPVILRCFANRCAMRGAWIIVAALLAAPALANTANGADKWKAGDWRGAVAAWQTPAGETGDDLAAWWTVFGDPALEALVAETRARNKDLAAATARMEAYAAAVGMAPMYWPRAAR